MMAKEVDIAVVGAGPAGLMAAIEGARAGAKVLVVDENSSPGGQLFKQIHKFFGSREHRAGIRGFSIGEELLDEAQKLGVEISLDTICWGIFPGPELALLRNDTDFTCRAERIIIATGASENALAFPGWTLPGVMGAGAAQTMINVHRVLPGQKVLMVGSGNVGLIVTYQLLQAGARVAMIVEAMLEIGGYGVHAGKIRRAGVPIRTRHTIISCQGENSVTSATIGRLDEKGQVISGSEETLDVDMVCLAVGLTPMAELLFTLKADFKYVPALGGQLPCHDEDMETSIEGIYVAGDVAGVEEASTAMEEGCLAGLACAESLGLLDSLQAGAEKQKVKKRLQALRSGPFGEHRQDAKEILTREGLIK